MGERQSGASVAETADSVAEVLVVGLEQSFKMPAYVGSRGRDTTQTLAVPSDNALDWGQIERDGLEAFQAEDQLFSAEGYIDRKKIEAQAQYLIEHRAEISEAYKSQTTYRDDARTLLFEALRASGHLSEVKISGTLEEIHSMMLTVLLNSINDTLPAHEQDRRFQEVCEELIRQNTELMIHNGQLPRDTQVATCSDYITPGSMPDFVAKEIGYKMENRKGMVRSSRLVQNLDGTYCRITDQISRSNADASRTRGFLYMSDIESTLLVDSELPDDVVVLGTQILHRMNGGVVDLMMMLDAHQSDQLGSGVRYGEMLDGSQLSYAELRAKSLEREAAAECYIDDLATFTKQLDISLREGKITQDQYNSELKHRILTILRAICVVDPEYAVACFGEASEAGFQQARRLAAQGDTAGAAAAVDRNKTNETSVQVCGMSLSEEEAKKRGIELTALENKLKVGMEKYKTKKGVCRVENCPTSPSQTDVGPCCVCTGSCQKLYDKGWSYARIKSYYRRKKRLDDIKNKMSKKREDMGEKLNGWFFKLMTS